MIASLNAMTVALRAQAHPPPQAPPPLSPPAPAPAHADPRDVPRFKEYAIFDVHASNVESWLDDIFNAVHLQRASLVNDYDRAIYITSYLKQGLPKSWFNGIRAANPDLLYNFTALLDDFRSSASTSATSTCPPLHCGSSRLFVRPGPAMQTF